MTARPRVFPAVPLPGGADAGASLGRADITVAGLDHGGGSYELRIFLDNPTADAGTPLELAAGYAGSIHVYGQGRPWPGVGDDAEPVSDAVTRPPRSIVATEAVRARMPRGGGELSITLVAVAVGGEEADIDLDASAVSVRID